MRSLSSALLITVAYISAASALQNTPPIPERVVGLGEGSGKLNVNFELHYDLMCSASAALHPAFKQFLDLDFQGGKVRDAVTVEYLFQPLPYHHGVWVPSKLVPFFTDECFSATSTQCRYIDYMEYCFQSQNQNAILGATGKSFN